jgi:hypothetical protein
MTVHSYLVPGAFVHAVGGTLEITTQMVTEDVTVRELIARVRQNGAGQATN